ncbi:MAG: hypothetical protein AAF614_32765 [Chloroflexota bacterium]
MSKSINLGTMQYAAIALAVITAVIHLALSGTFGILFVLNGLGFLGLIGLYYFGHMISPQILSYRSQIRWILIGYTALTVILYFVMNPNALSNALGLITKAVEVALIVLLLRE